MQPLRTRHFTSNPEVDPPDAVHATRMATSRVLAITGMMAAVLLTGSFAVRFQVNAHTGYDSLINLAGRQRMLSQKLAKLAVELDGPSYAASSPQLVDQLDETVQAWREADESLKYGTLSGSEGKGSESTGANLAAISTVLNKISNAGSAIVAIYREQRPPAKAELQPLIQGILASEPEFLRLMDDLVNKYQRNAEAQIRNTKRFQDTTTMAALLVVVLLGWFGFRPILVRNERLIGGAVRQREAALELSARLSLEITERIRGEKELLEGEAKFRLLFECSSDAHLLLGMEGVVDCNHAAVSMLRCSDKRQLLSLHPAILSPEFQPDGRRSLEKCLEMDATARRNGYHRFDWEHRRLDGTDVSVEVTLTPVQLAGKPVLLTVWHDLTERKQAEAELEKSKRFIEKITSMVPSGIFVYDLAAERCVYSNKENSEMFGYSNAEFLKMSSLATTLVHHDDRQAVRALLTRLDSEAGADMQEIEFRGLLKGGKTQWIWTRVTAFARNQHGQVTQVLGVNQDVTGRKIAEAALNLQAMTDVLTGLPNRRALMERISRKETLPIVAGTSTTCIADIDEFKQVNDKHGHRSGDEVLVAFSEVIRTEIRETDFTARLGGDEFCILFPDTNVENARKCVERIRSRVESIAFGLHGSNPFSVTVSFGLSQNDSGRSEAELLIHADEALYAAKGQGRNRAVVFREV